MAPPPTKRMPPVMPPVKEPPLPLGNGYAGVSMGGRGGGGQLGIAPTRTTKPTTTRTTRGSTSIKAAKPQRGTAKKAPNSPPPGGFKSRIGTPLTTGSSSGSKLPPKASRPAKVGSSFTPAAQRAQKAYLGPKAADRQRSRSRLAGGTKRSAY